MHRAEQIRDHLRFDVARLARAAERLKTVDAQLRRLRGKLEQRAFTLAEDGVNPRGSAGLDAAPIRSAQAQATADLARRAALGDVLRHSGALPLVASMAVSRWVDAIRVLPGEGSRNRRIAAAKGHIDAGRIAHRMLATLRSRSGVRSGCGQLVCAVVVAELSPPDLCSFCSEQVEEGWERALAARDIHDEDSALGAASAALREGARLLESMARRAELAVGSLLEQAEAVEARVARDLGDAGRDQTT